MTGYATLACAHATLGLVPLSDSHIGLVSQFGLSLWAILGLCLCHIGAMLLPHLECHIGIVPMPRWAPACATLGCAI